MKTSWILTLALLAPAFVMAQSEPTGLVANPGRPTISDPADVSPLGILEVEYGWDRAWSAGNARKSTAEGLQKFALFPNFELRWDISQFSGFENTIGGKYRFLKQTSHRPAMAFAYNVKTPSGCSDHDFTFLASKDVPGSVHLDFNVGVLLAGRDRPGHDRATEIGLSFSRPLRGRWSVTGELYGDTRLTADTPAFANTLWAITYNVKPRLVLDAGMDFGLTSGTPRKRVFAGFTYTITDVYAAIKRHGPPSGRDKD